MIEISFPGGLRVDAEAFGTTISTDQPARAGGDGSAPAPFLLFLASIGTCAGIYVLSFCRQRGIPTDDIRIRQSMAANPVTGALEHVGLDIQVPPSFPMKYHAALVKAANSCAVKKALENPPSFQTSVNVAGQAQAAK